MSKRRDDVITEASRWVAEDRSGDMTAEERSAMESWLLAHPDNAKAFLNIENLAVSAASLRSLADLEPRPAQHHTRFRAWNRPWAKVDSSNRHRWALTGIAASVATAALFIPNLAWWSDLDSATAVAETRILVLSDGTRVTLGPKSRIRTRFFAGERYAELAYGEAFFEVARDTNRPFIVDAGDTRVRVLGTKFDINHRAERVSTSVLHGIVQVREGAPLFRQKPLHLLRAYQRVETKADVALFDAPSIATVVPTDVPPGEWGGGRLTYS
jgi:transmembrane sensor